MSRMNGVPVMTGVDALSASAPLPPVMGHVRARVAHPLRLPPDISGRLGRAWRCDLAAFRAAAPQGAPRDAMVAHWVLEAPWSHEVVHSYSLVLLHLQYMIDKQPVVKHIPGASHEVHLLAIRPDIDRVVLITPSPIPMPPAWIELAFAAQIAEASDAAAEARVRRAAELVCDGRLSPHPLHARAWAEIFGDNMLRIAARG